MSLLPPSVLPQALQYSEHILWRLNSSLHTKGRVHQDGIVELSGGLGDVDRLHLLEAAQWVTLWNQLRDGALVEGARDQQDDVVNHVAVTETTK